MGRGDVLWTPCLKPPETPPTFLALNEAPLMRPSLGSPPVFLFQLADHTCLKTKSFYVAFRKQ